MKAITVQTKINDTLEKVWDRYTKPGHIIHWNFATPEWRCPTANNDVRVGGVLNTRMEAKDGSMGFDFIATYTQVKPMVHLEYSLEDNRKVNVFFAQDGNMVTVTGTFEPEKSNPEEMQQQGWQSIMDNFKKYVEST
ncbi:MAG: SRPBCC domain-containing protein [Saonia sp.]